MSAITHETDSAKRDGRKPAANHLSSAFGAMRKTRLLVRISNACAEARMHRALIEAQLYGNRFTHASKNDDELPILPVTAAEQSAPTVNFREARRRFAAAVVRAAKRAYPAILILSLLSTVVAATVAIRVVISLPSRLF